MSKYQLFLILFGVVLLSACGQKGPLFLPGDMSAGTVITPETSESGTEEKEDDEEESNND